MRQNLRKRKPRLVMRAAFLALCALIFVVPAKAQQQNMTNGTYELTSAGVSFYDSGGPGDGGNTRYQHNEEYVFVFTLPSTQASAGLKVEFSSLRVNDDHLYIYEGTAVDDSKLIADFTCNDYYYSFADLCASGNITAISHGAMTFRFESNEQYRDNGWAANITIVEQDQIASNVPAPVIAMQACQNVVELIPTMLTTEEEGNLQLFYSTDGTNFSEYSAPFNVSNGATVTAYAKLGNVQSSNHSVTINRAPIVAPTLIRVNEDENNELKVTRPEVPAGANDTYKVRYTLDGSDPTTSSTAQTIEWTHHTGQTDVNDMIIDISDAVFLTPTGNFQVKAVTQGTTCPNIMSEVVTYTTTTLYTATPEITLTGTGQTGNIAITCATSGATIYYTIDGSEPNPGADNTYVWGATGAPTTIAAGGTVKAYAQSEHREHSAVASAIYVPGGEGGGSGTYGGIVLLDDREPHTLSYYTEDSPIHSLNPRDVKITYYGNSPAGRTTMTDASENGNTPTSFSATATGVAVNYDAPESQFIYLKTLEAANENGSGGYPYTAIPNPFQVRPTYSGGGGNVPTTFTENFSSVNPSSYNSNTINLPDGWESGSNSSNNAYAPRVCNYNNGYTIANYDGNYLIMSARQGTSYYNWAIAPQYQDITAISFRFRFSSGSYGQLEVGYIVGTSLYTLQTISTSNQYSNGWTQYTLSSSDIATINDNGGQLVFMFSSTRTNNTWYHVAIDDVVITGIGSSSSNDSYRGFYAWRIKSLSDGLTISGKQVGSLVYADEEITFNTSKEEGNEVELEALWAQAYLTTSTSTSGLVSAVGYERNFMVLNNASGTSVSGLTVPCTVSAYYPDGTNGSTTSYISGTITCGADLKIENIRISGNSSTMTAAGHDLIIGRGVTAYSTRCATMVRGIGAATSESLDYTIRIESGTFRDLSCLKGTWNEDNTGITCSGSSVHVNTILGSDYDRAKKDNAKLSFNANDTDIEFGSAVTLSNIDLTSNTLFFNIKSGKIGRNDLEIAEYGVYIGISRLSSARSGVRKMLVEGGDISNIAGGVDPANPETGTSIYIRMKGGTVRGAIYGSGAFAAASGNRRMVFTGGKVGGWIAAGCNGTSTTQSGGVLPSDTYIYIGDDTEVGNKDGSTPPTINTSVGGNVFGAGSGNTTYETTGQVNDATVVVADSCYIQNNVFGGGNYGYTSETANIHVLGGTVGGSVFGGSNQKLGNVTNITMKDGKVIGNIYGGSNITGTVSGLATINVSGGEVTNVYGGGCGSATVMGSGTSVTVSGGTVIENVYGGGEQGTITSVGAVVEISGDATVNNVYGAGKGTQGTNVPFSSANITGPTTVTIKDEAHVLGSVYGGGENGSVGYVNNNSTATGSTVNIKGGVIENNVFGGGSYGVTNGNVVVNITWDNDEMAKTQIKGSVYGGAFGTRGKVYVKGTKTVNMNNGLVGNSVYGGSRNADDALVWSPTASGQTNTCDVVNISGGEVTYQVFASGYFGHTYGSVYAFIGEYAINNALEKAPTQGFNYAINPLRIRGSVWAGADFGNFDGHSFGAPTVEGKSFVYIDGTGYNTITDHPQVTGYMNIEGSVYGCGTSCDAGKTDTKVVVRNYGQPVATRSIVEPYQTATRSLYSIQRAKTIILDNAHINYLGQGRVNSLVTTEKYAIHNAEIGLYVVNGSSVMINRPIDEIKKLMNGTINDVYAASLAFTPENLSEQGTISVENKYRVYGGTYINVFYTTETENGTEEKYGELSGFAYMMTDAYEGEDDTKSCAYARPKWGQGAPFPQGSTEYDNPNDGGFISYNAGWNEFNANGENSANGVQMTYENHVFGSKNGEDYFRIWRYGGLHSYREAVLIAESNGIDDTYNICSTDIELPATEVGGYYRIQVKQGTSGTTINYGTDVETCNAGYYGDTYSTTEANWMSYGSNAFQTGQAMSAVSEGLSCITSYDNVNFGLVAIPQGAMAPAGNVNNSNWIINEDADALLAANNTKWTFSDNTEMPLVHFQLTYSNGISVNKVLDPVTIYFEQYDANGKLTDVVEVVLIITTKTTINQPVTTRVVALMQGKGECGDVYSGRVTLPSYPLFMNTYGDPSAWTLQSMAWSDEVNGQHTGASMVPYSENNPTFEGSDTKFSMLFYAATNKDYSWGWDDYNYGPFDVTDNNAGALIGQTMARKDFTINFDLYYDGSLTSTTQKMGELTFTFQFTHHNVGTNDNPEDETSTIVITIEVWRKGPGTNYYLDGVNGKNSYAGTRPDAAKLTLNAILSRTDYMAGDNIFIVNTVTQDDATTLSWDGSAYDNITIYRYPGGHPMAYGDESWETGYYADYDHENNPCFPGVMVDVKSEMEMHYITLNGFSEEINSEHPTGGDLAESFVEAFAATAPMIRIENGGELNLGNGTMLTCNDNTLAAIGENGVPGGAVKVDEGGTLSMFNSTITGNSTANTGGAVYMAGTMNISGKVNLTGNVKGNKQNNVFLSEFIKVITMTDEVDPESRIGITKDDWKLNGVTKWYNPVVFSNEASRLDVFYTDEDLGRMTDDKEMYQLNKLNLAQSEFPNSTKHLFFVGTWVTAVTFNPYFESRESEGYTDSFTDEQLANIHTPQQLAWAISLATGYNKVNNGAGYPDTDFTLTADIDMDDNIWVPIGNEHVKYTGTFNGNGHVVTGIRSPLDASDKGMFGVINGATIENVIIKTDFSDGNSANLAGLVGLMENGTIANCEVAGEVIGNANTQNMGGVAAKVENGTIHSVFAVSTLTGGEETVMGGLIGTNSGNLYNSYSNVTFTDGSNNTGGLVGVNTGIVENCYNASTATYAFVNQNQVTVDETTTKGNINFCYAAPNATVYVNSAAPGNLTGHGNYGEVLDRKDLGYMFYDNLIAANTNTYVGGEGITNYLEDHIPVWNGLLSALNQWVKANPAGLSPAPTKWFRSTSANINGDLPILGFGSDNCLATLDGKFLQYSATAYDDDKRNDDKNGIDALLKKFKESTEDVYVYMYNHATNVTELPGEKVNVFLEETAALIQNNTTVSSKDDDLNKANFRAVVGITFENSRGTAGNMATPNGSSDPLELLYDWHMMASPLKDAEIGTTYNMNATMEFGQPANINGMSGNYFPDDLYGSTTKWDLYTFYEKHYHWINLKRSTGNHWHWDYGTGGVHAPIPDYVNETYFEPAKGYMMAIEKDSYLSDDGLLNNNQVTVTLKHECIDETLEDEPGCNLIGNPFHAYLNMNDFISANSQNTGISTYYVYSAEWNAYMPNNAQASQNHVLPTSTLAPFQGFFVKIDESHNNADAIFTNDMTTSNPVANSYFREERVNYPLVNLMVKDKNDMNDVAVIEFNRPDKGGAENVRVLNVANFDIYAHMDDKDYSILFTQEGTERVPVWFRTKEDGVFTMTWETLHGNFTSLRLVDNKTGVNYDMLANDSYTFEASTDDYSSRFYITFTVTGLDEEISYESDNFAFFNGSEWVINGQGHLDVIDMTGRILYAAQLNADQNRVNLDGIAQGVYLLRVIDNKVVRTQKIIVR